MEFNKFKFSLITRVISFLTGTFLNFELIVTMILIIIECY